MPAKRYVLALLALSPASAIASPVDLYGYGARAMGRGMGGVALPDGAAGLFLNPAGLQAMEKTQAILGFALLRSSFPDLPAVRWDTNRDGRIDDTDPPLQPSADYGAADGLYVALGRPVGERFGLAVNLFFPTERLLDISTFEPSLPTYFLYANRPYRYEAAIGFGWEQLRGVSVGGAVEIIARAEYDLSGTLTAQLEGAEEGEDQLSDLAGDVALDIHEMSLDLRPDFAPVASLLWDVGGLIPPLEGLNLGGTWRGSTGLPVDVSIDLQVDASVGEVGDLEPTVLTLLAPFDLAVFDHYIPSRLSLGAAWDRGPVRAYVDGRRTAWSKMPLNVAKVVNGSVQGQLVGDPIPLRDGNDYAATLRDTWGVRLGVEADLPSLELGDEAGTLRPVLRAGWSLEPTPLESMGENVALLDSDRMAFTFGAGVAHDAPFGLFPGAVAWDAFGQVHPLAAGEIPVSYSDPYAPGAPVDGGGVPVGGRLWAAGVQGTIDY